MWRMSAPFSCISVAIVWAEQMARSALAELRRADALPDSEGQMIAAERLAVRRQEHREVVRLGDKLRTAFADVFL